MLSRLASRGAVAAARAAIRPRALPSVQTAFCSSAPAAKSSGGEVAKPDDVSFDGPLVRYGLTDWKISAPIGGALAIPFLANEWLILNEETQLVMCFAAFGTALYKFGGDAIGRSFDERQEAIISEINKLEEVEMKLLKETLEAAEMQLTVVEDVKLIHSKTLEYLAKKEELQVAEAKHKIREQFISWLNYAVAMEKTQKKAMVDNFINKTAVQVAKNFATDPNLKKAAVDQVIEILKNPNADMKDLVGDEFEKVGEKIWGEVSSASSGSKENLASIEAEYKALMAKKDKSEAENDAIVRLQYMACKAGRKL